MGRMRRGLIHTLAWTLATGAAVTLSWWGVRTVMSGTVYDPPRAVPFAQDAQALGSSTQRPGGPPSLTKAEGTGSSAEPSQSPGTRRSAGPGRGPGASKSAGSSPSASSPGSSSPPASSASTSSEVKSYPVTGGRVVFDLGASSAELVSATPTAGWKMQVWKQTEWIRVTFTQGNESNSVFCTWNDHPPTVEVDNR
ncbi:hypothetical protein [Streptomyces sp. NPDC050738]|uniref:hypothetical protein n=1 Tax=Streptomyces sp. NPDC050738 TaxID=3154744 RepID=UPI003439B7C1